MQAPASTPVINPNSIEINPEEYVAPRFSRKIKSKVKKSSSKVRKAKKKKFIH